VSTPTAVLEVFGDRIAQGGNGLIVGDERFVQLPCAEPAYG
jgi:hypothetical protein